MGLEKRVFRNSDYKAIVKSLITNNKLSSGWHEIAAK